MFFTFLKQNNSETFMSFAMRMHNPYWRSVRQIKKSLKTGIFGQFFFHEEEYNLRSWIVMDMKVLSKT